MSLGELLLGLPRRAEQRCAARIGVLIGIPALGLDALASAAYGPEAALTVLLALGVLAPACILPLSALVGVVLLAVFASYLQTLSTYPDGGGAFTVARENLGRVPALLAASALSIDYVLNVAVAISAGVAALTSAAPRLWPYTLPLCLAILALLTIVNLRGVHAAGRAFMFPTYLFVACLGVTIAVGLVKTVLAHGHPVAMAPPASLPAATTVASFWLLARAFASGCTALTGVEAVSNAVPMFRPPTVVTARRTLTSIVSILAYLIAGVAVLSRAYHIGATPPGQAGYQSVLSQIVAAVAGRGIFYFVTMTSILMVLALSANTSFAGFPRVSELLARDHHLPARFTRPGAGVIVLTLLSGALLIVYGGITDRLIPMFAIGAFTTFTLSQLGMVAHWLRVGGPRAIQSLVLNGFGALATASTLVIITISKFREGAWLTILVISPVLLLFAGVRRYRRREAT